MGAPAAPSDKQAAEDACGTMQAALETLQGRPDASAPVPSRQQLEAGVQHLRMEVAKVGLLYGSPAGQPSAAERDALLKGLQNGAAGVCMLLLAAAGRGGPTLRGALQRAARRLVEACVGLVRGALVDALRGEALLVLVGRCMEQCDAVTKAPLDNKTAIGREITKVLKTLADASRELQEIAPELSAAASREASGPSVAEAAPAAAPAAAGPGSEQPIAQQQQQQQEEEEEEQQQQAAGAAAAGDDAGSGEEFGVACEDLGAAQLEVVRSVHSMLGAVGALLRAVVRMLLAAGAAPEAPGGRDEWEGLLFHVRTLATEAEDLAAGIYPPQDCEELDGAAEAVVNCCELICEETPVEGAAAAREGEAGGGSAQQGSPAPLAELQHALAGVQAAHERLAEALAAAQ